MPDNESNTPRTESSNAPSVIDTISDIGTVSPQDDDLLIIRRGDAKGLFYFDADGEGVADEIDVLDGPDSVGRWLRITDRPSLDGARDVLLASGVTDADEIYFLLTNSQGETSTNEKMSIVELAKASGTVLQFDTVADMIAATGLQDEQLCQTARYSSSNTVGDGSGNEYQYNTTGRPTEDLGFFFDGAGADDYFAATNQNELDIMKWGAVWGADILTPFQRVIDKQKSLYGFTLGGAGLSQYYLPPITLPGKKFLLSDEVTAASDTRMIYIKGNETQIVSSSFAGTTALNFRSANYNLMLEGLNLYNFPSALEWGTETNNWPVGRGEISRCTFSADQSTETGVKAFNRSTEINFRECVWLGYDMALDVNSDKCIFDNCRIRGKQTYGTARKKHQGFITVRSGNFLWKGGVANVGTAAPASIGTYGVAWVYVPPYDGTTYDTGTETSVTLQGVRFGGEGGGLPCVLWDRAAQDITTDKASFGFRVQDCDANNANATGSTLIDGVNSAPLCELLQIPNFMEFTGNVVQNSRSMAIDFRKELSLSFTADDTTDVLTVAAPLLDGQAVTVTTDGTLPSPLAADTTYYVINRTDSGLQLSATLGGSAIDIADTGTGTHNIVRAVPEMFTPTTRIPYDIKVENNIGSVSSLYGGDVNDVATDLRLSKVNDIGTSTAVNFTPIRVNQPRRQWDFTKIEIEHDTTLTLSADQPGRYELLAEYTDTDYVCYLNGTNGYIDTGYTSIGPDLSMAFWYFGTYMSVEMRASPGANGLLYVHSGTSLILYDSLSATDTYITSSDKTMWQHYGLTISGTTGRMYLNGTMVKEFTVAGYVSSTKMHIGRQVGFYRAGRYKDFIFWDGVVVPAEDMATLAAGGAVYGSPVINLPIDDNSTTITNIGTGSDATASNPVWATPSVNWGGGANVVWTGGSAPTFTSGVLRQSFLYDGTNFHG